ncbi:hypothetical protein SDC9_21312 [bioreactor metagenome]|uniref:Uncharacterized protein n=1 Tax=bioreactor metagenome TaxID=1076179 RepID=A0A644U965_9ZZZZ
MAEERRGLGPALAQAGAERGGAVVKRLRPEFARDCGEDMHLAPDRRSVGARKRRAQTRVDAAQIGQQPVQQLAPAILAGNRQQPGEARRVDDQQPVDEARVGLGGLGLRPRVALQGALDRRGEARNADQRFQHHRVGAHGKQRLAGLGPGVGGAGEDRQPALRLAGTQGGDDATAVELGHLDVDHRKVVVTRGEQGERLAAVVGGDAGRPHVVEHVADHCLMGAAVIGDEDAQPAQIRQGRSLLDEQRQGREHRHDQRDGGAAAGPVVQLDPAAEPLGHVAGDGEAEAVAGPVRGGAALAGLEQPAEQLGRKARTVVSHADLQEAAGGQAEGNLHHAPARIFERIRQQVRDCAIQRQPIHHQNRRHVGGEGELQGDAPFAGMARPADLELAQQPGGLHLLRTDRLGLRGDEHEPFVEQPRGEVACNPHPLDLAPRGIIKPFAADEAQGGEDIGDGGAQVVPEQGHLCKFQLRIRRRTGRNGRRVMRLHVETFPRMPGVCIIKAESGKMFTGKMVLSVTRRGGNRRSPERAPPVRSCRRVADRLQRRGDLVEDRRVVDRGGHLVVLPVGDLHHRAAQDLARAGLRQAVDDDRGLECRDRADLVAHEGDAFAHDRLLVAGAALVQAQEADRGLALQLVGGPDHRAFGDVGMRGEHLLHRAGRQPVARDVDHVIGARHDVEIAVLVLVARVAGLVIAREMAQVTLLEAVLGIPQRRQRARRQRQLDRDRAELAILQRVAALVEDLHVIAGHRHRGRAELRGQQFDAERVRGNRPAGLGLPPVVDHRHAEVLLRPFHRVRVGAFAGQEQRLHLVQLVALDPVTVRILAPDRAQRGRRGEEALDPVVLDHPPEHARVRRTDGLALEHHGGRAGDQRTIADVAVADDPTHVRGGPEPVARLDVVDVLHRPVQRDEMAAGGPDHALRCAGRARGVEDIGGVVALDRHAFGRAHAILKAVPGEVAAFDQLRHFLLALEDHAELGLVGGDVDRLVKQRLVMHDAVRFEAAGGGDDRLRRAVVDPHRKLMRGEPAEHHRVDRADAGAGEHRLERLGDHRHVDDDAVALLDAAHAQRAGERGDALLQFFIGDALGRMGDRAFVHDRDLVAATGQNMAVDRVPAGVDHAIREPFVDRGLLVEERLRGFLDPVDLLRRLHPEPLRVGLPGSVDVLVCHCMPPPSWFSCYGG